MEKLQVLRKNKTEKESFHIVAIGASVGGLEAISIILRNLPSDTGMAFIIVQHLSPNHKSFLSAILSKITEMKVQEVENMEHMMPNNVYVIPNNKIIEVTDGHIKLLTRPKNSSVTSIDILFTSLAETHHKDVIGIVLSGNATDGTIGLKAIKDAGGLTFAQDASAQASSMPASAIAAGVVDFILSPEEMAHELVDLSENGFLRMNLKEKKKKDSIENHNSDLNTIFELLLKETGVDFSHYKMPTIKRRINHKMLHCGIKTIKEYAKYLGKNETEIEVLYQDLLINVTSFFRDPEAFHYLKTTLLPKLLKGKSPDETLRIWVPACSTGEEAYSIAMMVTELQDHKSSKIPIQIFATDLSEQAIRDARVGEYSSDDVKTISKKYMDRFFIKAGEKFCIVKELREMCVFAPHNILRDPPFSRMDFISCCNLLIYFDSAAQKKVFTTLHFALNDSGAIMLGKAETIGTSSPFFSRINNKYKIYSRKKNTGARKTLELTPRFPRTNMSTKKISPATKSGSTNPAGIENAIDSILLASYMPACAVVNKEMEILQFRGPVSLYLEHPSGKASLNILKMTRPEFAFELRNAIHKVIKTKESIKKTGIEIKIESVLRMMSFEVCPLTIEWDEPLLLVVFTLQDQVEKFMETDSNDKTSSLKDRRIKKLTDELKNTRAEMNSIIEAQEITYEELQSANEEIVSSNEEFQTLNEELETSKEEIEATNEELISTNQELQVRNDLLTESHEYSEAIFATIHEPILILDKNFHVKSANKSFYKKFQVKKEETEGQLLFDLGDKQWNIPKLREVLNKIISKNHSFENFEVTHVFSGIGEKNMLLNARLIIQKANSEKLILLAIEDITEQSRFYIKENTERKKAEEKFRGFLESAPDAIVIVDSEGKIQLINSQTEKLFGYLRDEIIGKEVEKLIPSRNKNTQNNRKGFLNQEPNAKTMITGIDLFGQHKDGKEFPVEVSLSQLKTDDGILISVAIRDITEQKRISNELSDAKALAEFAQNKAENATQIAEDAMKAKQQFLANMSHEIRTPMNAIIGFTKVVLKTDLTDKQKEYLSAIKISGDALIVLINDILDLAKVDAGKLIFEQKPFKMSCSISAMLHIFETKIQEKNLQLVRIYDEAIPEILLGDSVRLHQIILNLVSNSIKFTSKGKITVSIRLIDQDDEKVTIEFAVTDTGIGIAQNEIASIFENFQQASNGTSRLYGGTGLGLAIVKQLVESQHGTIQVKSTLGKGSTFSFSLCFGKTNAPIEIENELIESETTFDNIKILVVEDIALNQLLMKTLLDDFGFERDIVDNGKRAIEKLQNNSYDIILMDLQMPEMNGFEATEYIRNKMKSTIPIIALTADVTTVDLEKCMNVGMNDYIAKPVDEKVLYNKIIKLLKQVKTQNVDSLNSTEEFVKTSCINLNYLKNRTKSNPILMMEMISLYLEQTPTTVDAMRQSLKDQDWDLLQSAVHKMIPSFSIMGISNQFEIMVKKIQELILSKQIMEIPDLILELENVCIQSCLELQEEYNQLRLRSVN